jgi:hypothetical protein
VRALLDRFQIEPAIVRLLAARGSLRAPSTTPPSALPRRCDRASHADPRHEP